MKPTEKITAAGGGYPPPLRKDKPPVGQKRKITDRPFNEVITEIIEKAYPNLRSLK